MGDLCSSGHVREHFTQFVVCSDLPVDLSLMRLRAVLHGCILTFLVPLDHAVSHTRKQHLTVETWQVRCFGCVET